MKIATNYTIDAEGLVCPMPIVKTKKMIDELSPGEVLEIRATDRGSLADMKGWAQTTGHQYLGTQEEGEVLIHYLRKSNPEEVSEVEAFEQESSNEELEEFINHENVTVLDVREPAEYAFGHVPGAHSIPLGELNERMDELDKEQEIYVVCRTGNRSNLAAHQLKEAGFTKLANVVPGMSEWDGPTETK
ncbi:sulfurtransferase TusA family protein [Salsuginibacillus kocurii]|uniref:sulfurtransferase TusA family protein n=1 Tax=Salsuginibacillus kocurii TaxID=427078 RepID=UPI0003656912|nr:sulfurtransferase TusA family protein [Salsuginibacillus kocurii]